MFDMWKKVKKSWEHMGMVATLNDAQRMVDIVRPGDHPVQVLFNTIWPRARVVVTGELGAPDWQAWCRREVENGRGLGFYTRRFLDNPVAGESIFRVEHLSWMRDVPNGRPSVWAHRSPASTMLINRMLLAEMTGLTLIWQDPPRSADGAPGKKRRKFCPFVRGGKKLKHITSVERIADAVEFLVDHANPHPVVEFTCGHKLVFDTPGARVGTVVDRRTVWQKLVEILGVER